MILDRLLLLSNITPGSLFVEDEQDILLNANCIQRDSGFWSNKSYLSVIRFFLEEKYLSSNIFTLSTWIQFNLVMM